MGAEMPAVVTCNAEQWPSYSFAQKNLDTTPDPSHLAWGISEISEGEGRFFFFHAGKEGVAKWEAVWYGKNENIKKAAV